MSNFLGSELVTLDAKGRLIVPARMRNGLSPEANDTFVIVRGFDACVNMYPLDEWNTFDNRLRELKTGDDDVRSFISVLYETAHKCSLDGSNRVQFTDPLIEMGGLTRGEEVKVLGLMGKLEIWHPKRWEQKRAGIDTKKFDELARKFLS